MTKMVISHENSFIIWCSFCSDSCIELGLTWHWKPRGPVASIHYGVISHPEECCRALPPHSSEPGASFFSTSVHPNSHGWSGAGEGARDDAARERFTVQSIGHLYPVIAICCIKTCKNQLYVSVWNFQLPFLNQNCQ